MAGTGRGKRDEARQRAREKLLTHLEDAHAMEENIVRSLDSMILATADRRVAKLLADHRRQTVKHSQLVRDRLVAHDRTPSIAKEMASLPGTMLKGVTDQVRGDRTAMNARDAFVAEHLEIAVYEIVERLADQAGDRRTAAAARRIRRDEQAMARRIADRWDRFVELALAEA